MIVNNHRKHSSFALKYFIAGSCYTPDAAYCLLYAQMEQLEMDLAAGEANVLTQEADVLELDNEIKLAIDNNDRITELRKRAEKIKLEGMLKNFKLNYEGTKREYKEIQELLEQLKPQCKYWNEDILQMEQDMQRDEWVGELKGRAENMTLGNILGIGYDHIATMRQHPDFNSKILPHIKKIRAAISSNSESQVENTLLGKPEFLNTLMLEKPSETQNAD